MKKVAPKTLLTNKIYKKVLINFLGDKITKTDMIKNPIIQAEIISKDIENKRLKEEVLRLEKALSKNYSDNDNCKDLIDNSRDDKTIFFHMVVSEFKEFIDFDDKGNLVNKVNFPPSIIIKSSDVQFYKEFLENNGLTS